jgi:hypothetical protein
MKRIGREGQLSAAHASAGASETEPGIARTASAADANSVRNASRRAVSGMGFVRPVIDLFAVRSDIGCRDKPPPQRGLYRS